MRPPTSHLQWRDVRSGFMAHPNSESPRFWGSGFLTSFAAPLCGAVSHPPLLYFSSVWGYSCVMKMRENGNEKCFFKQVFPFRSSPCNFIFNLLSLSFYLLRHIIVSLAAADGVHFFRYLKEYKPQKRKLYLCLKVSKKILNFEDFILPSPPPRIISSFAPPHN